MKKTALNVHNKLYIKEFISSFKIFKKSLESYQNRQRRILVIIWIWFEQRRITPIAAIHIWTLQLESFYLHMQA